MSNQAPASYATRRYNPITGCAGGLPCVDRCWAKSFAIRHRGRFGYPKSDPFRPTFHPDRLEEPLRWKDRQVAAVSFMGDVGSPGVKDEWLCALWAVMSLTPRHTYLILTKQPERLGSWLRDPRTYPGVLDAADPIRRRHEGMQLTLIGISNPATVPLRNVLIGTSFGNQPEADERVPRVLLVPAAYRWASYEPATGPADLTQIRLPPELSSKPGDYWTINALTDQDDEHFHNSHAKLDWVVMGCESGPRRRPFDPAWARAVRNRCAEHGTPFYLKQATGCGHEECHCREDDGECTRPADHPCEDHYEQSKVFKHPTLDGVRHAAVPWEG